MPRNILQAFAAQANIARKRFVEILEKNALPEQDGVLRQCLEPNASTVFGAEHRFSTIRDLSSFKAAVPIRHYDDLEPWIERAAEGEPRVLTAEDPIRFWKTTGTTAKSKKIPVTPASAARTTESFFTLQGVQALHHPGLYERSDAILFTHISPRPVKERLGGRFPFCTTTEVPIEVKPGHEDLVAPWLLPLQALPDDDTERLYFLLCYAATHELRAIGCLHPSRFQTVAALLERESSRLIREVAEGTLLGKKTRDARPDIAARLEAKAKASGALLPKDIWPTLELVTSWSGTYIRRYSKVMEEAFSREFIPMPSISSECFMTMTVDKDPIGQPLNVRGGVFEFIPSGERVEPGTRTLDFHELEVGSTYEVIITTLGGLYRYATCDIFRVTGFVGKVPRLEYIGRRSVSDLTGEKLAEEQVVEAMKQVLAECGVVAANYTVCGVIDADSGRRPRYVLVLEPDGEWSPERSDAVGRRLDDVFKSINSRYQMKRSFSDLDPVAVEAVPRGTFDRYRSLLIERGMPAGQLKDRVLQAVGSSVLQDLLRLRR